jgi:hypothetical protein
MNNSKRRNLIITRAGPASKHRQWNSSQDVEPTFDVFVSAYHPAALSEDMEHIKHLHVPGPKVAGWNTTFRQSPELIERYQAIALLDDDLEITTTALNKCFELGAKRNLSIWQPAFSWDSYVSFAGSLANPFFEMRFVNHVEMGCPFFSTDLLKLVLPLFALGFESGIDLVWCSIAKEQGGQCAIVDQCIIKHPRPVGGKSELNGFINFDYGKHIDECLKLFSMQRPWLVASGAITNSGRKISSPFLLALAAAVPFLTVFRAPPEQAPRHKLARAYLRRQITLRPAYGDGVTQRLRALATARD